MSICVLPFVLSRFVLSIDDLCLLISDLCFVRDLCFDLSSLSLSLSRPGSASRFAYERAVAAPGAGAGLAASLTWRTAAPLQGAEPSRRRAASAFRRHERGAVVGMAHGPTPVLPQLRCSWQRRGEGAAARSAARCCHRGAEDAVRPGMWPTWQ